MSSVDLTVLKRLVSELERELETADALKLSGDKVEWIVALNKATGLATGVMTESGLLMGDIQLLAVGNQQPSGTQAGLLEKLMTGLKGTGGSN